MHVSPGEGGTWGVNRHHNIYYRGSKYKYLTLRLCERDIKYFYYKEYFNMNSSVSVSTGFLEFQVRAIPCYLYTLFAQTIPERFSMSVYIS